jgi:7-carboxy-7-deazaguanine synthase
MTIVFNQDRNVRQSDYKPPSEGAVLVVKAPWVTLQGEGPYVGYPAIFIRLAGCNLGKKDSCSFCDSQFAFDKGTWRTPGELVLAVYEIAKGYTFRDRLVVLTGGEPFLQEVAPLIDHLIDAGWTVQAETNGFFWNSRLSNLLTKYPNSFKIVVSPKVNQRKIYPEFKEDLFYSSTCLKILIEDDPGSPYYRIPPFAFTYADNLRKPVYISPINAYRREPHPNQEVVSFWGDSPLDPEQSARNYMWAAHLCQLSGFRLSLQTHLFATVE